MGWQVGVDPEQYEKAVRFRLGRGEDGEEVLIPRDDSEAPMVRNLIFRRLETAAAIKRHILNPTSVEAAIGFDDACRAISYDKTIDDETTNGGLNSGLMGYGIDTVRLFSIVPVEDTVVLEPEQILSDREALWALRQVVMNGGDINQVQDTVQQAA